MATSPPGSHSRRARSLLATSSSGAKDPLIKEADWPDFKTLWDYNVYFHEGGEPVTFLSGKKYTFEQWKALGHGPAFGDRGSLVRRPGGC